MQVQIKLTDEQVDDILLEGLKDGFKTNLNFKQEPEYEHIHQAFLTLIRYYTTPSQLKEFVKELPKDIKKDSAKRLAEAYGGL
jgi:hypothetical protein